MSNLNRLHAINSVAERKILLSSTSTPDVLGHYAEDVFNETAIQKYLSKEVSKKLLRVIAHLEPFDSSIADEVAHGMKTWAMERGATHFTHWFQPLTGKTAEKHDAFLNRSSDGKILMAFSGKNLIVSEPDASSFPSGGLRCTFEARGYTAWDPTSPVFIKRHANGATLLIPTIFCSYNGEVLDKKAPLLRSCQAISKATSKLMTHFGLPEKPVSNSLGAEQEYFLIDKHFYMQRPDLVQTGRTLFGAPPAKHQQLEDHYFGAIKPRILAFMTDVEYELWKLGIPAKTRHNEVAPAQFELAPIYEELNLAIDHNLLTMEVLKQVADRHGLVCLLHEKPFMGINGSGKHNNWTLNYGNKNLLEPGDTPHENAIFLTILCAIIRAIDLHSDILRSATASAGNDHRLGANEAPPAIISIFLGEQLTDIIKQIESGTVTGSKKSTSMLVGVDAIPSLPRDVTDRNRTSPFAFTGNKFEFRAPGSSESCSDANICLNTIIAESIDYISARLEQMDEKDFASGLQKLLASIITKHKRIIFNDDSYTQEWENEANRRDLPNLKSTPLAIAPLLSETCFKMFEKYNVFSRKELNSRYEVYLSEYKRKINIEGKVALEIARSIVFPVAANEYQKLVSSYEAARKSKIIQGTKGVLATINKIGEALDLLTDHFIPLENALEKDDCVKINTEMNNLRKVVDFLETQVDDSKWPLPKYREMLFIY